MSGCTLSLEELENDCDFDKKKPRGLVCYKRDNWKTSVHFVSEEAYAFQAATGPLPDICKDFLDSRIYDVYDEILWKESEKADSLYDTQDFMDYEKSWKEVSEESAFPDHGGLVYPLEGKSLEDRVEDLGDQHPDRAALAQEDRLDIRIASVEAFKRLTNAECDLRRLRARKSGNDHCAAQVSSGGNVTPEAAQIFVFQSYILHVEQDDLVNHLTAEFLRNCWYSTRCVSLSHCCWDLRPHLYACKASL
eukprot:g41351.t1